MIKHADLGGYPFQRSRNLKLLLDKNEIVLAGNSKLKIYGTLNCSSGKRMKVQNRVFFSALSEAVELDYRPCGNCLQEEYKYWKASQT